MTRVRCGVTAARFNADAMVSLGILERDGELSLICRRGKQIAAMSSAACATPTFTYAPNRFLIGRLVSKRRFRPEWRSSKNKTTQLVLSLNLID